MKPQFVANYVIFRKFNTVWEALWKTAVHDLLVSYVNNVHGYGKTSSINVHWWTLRLVLLQSLPFILEK